MRVKLLLVLVLLPCMSTIAQVRLKSCIGCGGASVSNSDFYMQSSVGQSAIADTDQSPSFRSGFVFIDAKGSSIRQAFDCRIYPNPTTHLVNIVGDVEGGMAKIYDCMGREIGSSTLTNHSILSVKKWAKGTYLLQITQNGVVQSYRIVKL